MKIFKKYNIIIYIFLIICATIIITYNVFEYQKTKSIVLERKNIVDEQVPTNDNIPTIDFEKIRKKYDNKDIKGVIRIDNENFEKVVLQTTNNTYYLTHNFSRKKKNGEIFLEANLDIDSSKIKVLNANGSKDSNIFRKYYDEQYYSKHKYIELETDKLIYKYEVLLVYSGSIDYKNFDIDKVIENSKYIYNLDFTKDNEFLIIEKTIDNKEISIVCKKVD